MLHRLFFKAALIVQLHFGKTLYGRSPISCCQENWFWRAFQQLPRVMILQKRCRKTLCLAISQCFWPFNVCIINGESRALERNRGQCQRMTTHSIDAILKIGTKVRRVSSLFFLWFYVHSNTSQPHRIWWKINWVLYELDIGVAIGSHCPQHGRHSHRLQTIEKGVIV